MNTFFHFNNYEDYLEDLAFLIHHSIYALKSEIQFKIRHIPETPILASILSARS